MEKAKEVEVKEVEVKYEPSQFKKIAREEYGVGPYVIDALLSNEKTYTKSEVRKIIDNWLNKKAKQ